MPTKRKWRMRSRLSSMLTKVGSENWRHGWQRSNMKGKGWDGVSTPDASKVIFTNEQSQPHGKMKKTGKKWNGPLSSWSWRNV